MAKLKNHKEALLRARDIQRFAGPEGRARHGDLISLPEGALELAKEITTDLTAADQSERDRPYPEEWTDSKKVEVAVKELGNWKRDNPNTDGKSNARPPKADEAAATPTIHASQKDGSTSSQSDPGNTAEVTSTAPSTSDKPPQESNSGDSQGDPQGNTTNNGGTSGNSQDSDGKSPEETQGDTNTNGNSQDGNSQDESSQASTSRNQSPASGDGLQDSVEHDDFPYPALGFWEQLKQLGCPLSPLENSWPSADVEDKIVFISVDPLSKERLDAPLVGRILFTCNTGKLLGVHLPPHSKHALLGWRFCLCPSRLYKNTKETFVKSGGLEVKSGRNISLDGWNWNDVEIICAGYVIDDMTTEQQLVDDNGIVWDEYDDHYPMSGMVLANKALRRSLYISRSLFRDHWGHSQKAWIPIREHMIQKKQVTPRPRGVGDTVSSIGRTQRSMTRQTSPW